MSRSKMGWRATVLVVPMALAFAAFSSAQQTAASADTAALSELMQKTERAAAIDANKGAFVNELLGRWSQEAAARGYDTYWSKERQNLLAKSGEELLRLSEAADLDTFQKLLSGGFTVNAFGSLSQELVFFPMAACRVYDSRLATIAGLAGPMAPATQRAISVNDTAGQGGTSPDCQTTVPDLINDPPALALVLTAASPTGPGNLRTFATGAAVPNAAQLTYTAGTTISTGAISDSCSSGGCSAELTIRNQGAGSTDVVVDIVGYFHAPFLQPLNAQVVTASQASTAINSGWNLLPACPAGTSLTGGGVNTSYANFNGVSGTLTHFENGPQGNSWSCRGWNGTNLTLNNVTCSARCARVPGR